MARSDDYKLGYSCGYSKGRETGRRRGGEAWKHATERVNAAVARAERAEAGNGLGICRDCARWTRKSVGVGMRWGWCETPELEHANGNPIWMQPEERRLCTSDHFGCVLFRARDARDDHPDGAGT